MTTSKSTKKHASGAPVLHRWSAGVLVVVGVLGLVAATALNWQRPLGDTGLAPGALLVSVGSILLMMLGILAVGALIAVRRPGNPIGWLLMLGAVQFILQGAAQGYAFQALGLGRPLPGALVANWLGQWLGVTAYLSAGFIFLLFPDGRFPAPRWRRAAVGYAVLAGAYAVAFAAESWPRRFVTPSSLAQAPPYAGDTATAGLWPAFMVLLALTLLAVVARYVRGDVDQRAQIRWLALAGIGVALGPALYALQQRWTLTAMVLAALGGLGLPVAFAVAILRHRLYDIDVVLSRTIVFVTLAAFITAVYALTVVGIGTLIGDPTNPALTIGTTALIALVFEPVRARVQHVANRAVYGRRATPYEVLTSIVDDLPTGEASHDQLEGLASLLADGTGARHATIWVQVDGVLRAAACAPAHAPATHDQATVDAHGQVRVPQATHVEPVRLDGELLGALSFERRRDDPATPHDRTLLSQMAGQAALVLGNAQLRERLRLRVEELRASRRQLVAAQDEARRKLERDLHDGAQQQLVALKVKLGLARSIATKEDAGEQVTDLIAQLSATTDLAVDALRTLARGIYPPLLESEGLERALITHAHRCPIPVDVHAEGVGRYERQVEATVYFCVLEALRNAVTHADATHLVVRLEDREGQLDFEVADDGRGFDPDEVAHGLGLTNMADRIDALGGELSIDTGAERGTRVVGSLPVGASTVDEHPGVLATA